MSNFRKTWSYPSFRYSNKVFLALSVSMIKARKICLWWFGQGFCNDSTRALVIKCVTIWVMGCQKLIQKLSDVIDERPHSTIFGASIWVNQYEYMSLMFSPFYHPTNVLFFEVFSKFFKTRRSVKSFFTLQKIIFQFRKLQL